MAKYSAMVWTQPWKRSESLLDTPSSSAITIAGSRSAKSTTRSISPRPRAASIRPSAISWTRCRSCFITLAVKAPVRAWRIRG